MQRPDAEIEPRGESGYLERVYKDNRAVAAHFYMLGVISKGLYVEDSELAFEIPAHWTTYNKKDRLGFSVPNPETGKMESFAFQITDRYKETKGSKVTGIRIISSPEVAKHLKSMIDKARAESIRRRRRRRNLPRM